MPRLLVAFALLLWIAGCRSAPPLRPLPPDDPRPFALLESWRAHVEPRRALFAEARLAVDAAGAGAGGADLSLRSKQRLWLARPARLRVEILGLFDTTLAVLTTDGMDYALFEAAERRFESGPVYEGLLWDAARLDLSPAEAVEVILGAPRADRGLSPGAALALGDGVRIALVDADGVLRRVVDFDAAGRLRRLEHRSAAGAVLWEAAWDDYAEQGGGPFARRLTLRGGGGNSVARLVLRRIELNPSLAPELFRAVPPAAVRGGER